MLRIFSRYRTSDRNVRERWLRTIYKIFSLFCAIVLWFYVLNAEPLEIERELELVVIPPAGLAISNEVSDHIKVKLQGARAFIMSYSGDDEKIVVDLRRGDYREGKFTVGIDASSILLPFGIEVTQLNPERLGIELQKEIRKKVPIRPNYYGDLPDELRLMSGDVKPGSVMISGPLEVMRRTTSLRTQPIDRQSLSGEGSIPVSISDLDRRVKIVDEGAIEFFYEVKPKKANLVLRNIPIKFLSSNFKINSKVKAVSIDVLAPEGIRIKESEVQVIAEIPDNATGQVEVKLKAILPEGIHLMTIHPENIKLSVKK
jgi:YbbR domain-containing protein